MNQARRLASTIYDRIASGYEDRWSRHVREPQDRLTRGLRLFRGARCADLGCGTGLETVEMLKQVAPGEVVGVDCSEEMLRAASARAASERLRLTTQCADAEAFIRSAEDASFDVVSLRFCLAYLDWRSSLVRLGSAIRAGGRIGVLTNLSTSTPQAYAVYTRIADEIGLPKVSLPVPDTIEQVSEVLHRGGLRTEDAWIHRLRLWFGSGIEAADWLRESGFVTHPALGDFDPEVLEWLVALFARRLEEYRAERGVPLDFDLGGVIAARPRAE